MLPQNSQLSIMLRFFTNNMISSGSEDLETLVPARLTIVGKGTSGSLVEGSIISRGSQSVASFQPGAGSPQGLIVPEGTYFLHIDRVVKIASISGPVLTLASAWPFPTTGSYQSYGFDISGAIVSNANVMSQTEIKKYKKCNVSVQGRHLRSASFYRLWRRRVHFYYKQS